MKTTEECLSILKNFKEDNSQKYFISRIGIFGSVARGEQSGYSDLDVCVELQKPSLFIMVHIKDDLQRLTECNVNILRIRPDMDFSMKQSIIKDAIFI